MENMHKLGTPEAYNHYAVGWAHALDTPYQWTKQVASHYGGTRNGCIVHWPKGIQAKGELREQFTHVIDVGPTLLEAARLPEPAMVNGVQQTPMQGVSMGYSFDEAKAPERHQTQDFEILGNRGIYHQGWTGTHQVRMEFAYDGGGVGKGGTVSLYVDGKKVGEGRVARTMANTLSLDETADVGCEMGSPGSSSWRS